MTVADIGLENRIPETTDAVLEQIFESHGQLSPRSLSDDETQRMDRYTDMLFRPSRMPVVNQVFVQERGTLDDDKTFHITNIDPEIKDATAYEIQPGTFIVFDSTRVPMGAFQRSIYSEETKYEVELRDIRSVITQEGTVLPQAYNDDMLREAVSWIFESIDPDLSSISNEQLQGISVKSIPLEYLLHMFELMQKFPETRDDIVAFVQEYSVDGLVVLSGVDSLEEYDNLQVMMKQDDKDVRFLVDFFSANAQMNDVYHARLGITDQMRALHSYLHLKEQSMLKAVVRRWGTREFSWDHVGLGLMGLKDVILDVLRYTKDSNEEIIPYTEGLTELVLENADNEHALAFAAPVVERRWIAQMKLVQPGEFQKAATFFYEALRPTLTEQADSSTGDTKKELFRLKGITEWLVHQHMIPTDGNFRYADFGSGDGKRILLPYLNWLRENGIVTETVDAVDLLNQPLPSDGEWRFVQADLSNPNLQLYDRSGKPAKYHVITGSWSLITDQDQQGQIDMLQVVAHHLEDEGIGILDAPTFDTYKETINAYHKEHPDEPIGVFMRAFYLADGTTISKKFYVPPPVDLPIQLLACGLKLVTEYGVGKPAVISGVPSRYLTSAGQERMTVVVEKMRAEDAPKYQLIGASKSTA